jgi:hypothetical protein
MLEATDMRAVINLLSIVVSLPYLVLAGGFLLLGHSIKTGSLLGFFKSTLEQALWLLSGGGIVVASCIIVLAALGFLPSCRWAAAAIVGIVSGGSLLVICFGTSGEIGVGELLFLLPSGLSMFGAGWLAIQEWPFRRKGSIADRGL